MYKVLIIDDEKIIRIAMQSMIDWAEQGFSICGTAADGDTAFQIIQKHHPHLIFVDLMMPKMDGISFIKQLRSTGYTGRIIILSNHSNFEYAVEALRYQVSDYILKTDISPEHLISLLVKEKVYLNEHSKDLEPSFEPKLSKDISVMEQIFHNSSESPVFYEFSDSYLFLEIFLRDKISKTNEKIQIPKNTLRNMIQEIPKLSQYQIIQPATDTLFVIVPHKELSEFADHLPSLTKKFASLVKLYMNRDCGFFRSNSFNTTEELFNLLSNLFDYEQLILFYGFHSIITEECLSTHGNDSLSLTSFRLNLRKSLSSKKETQCKELLSQVFNSLQEGNFSVSSVHRELAKLYSFLIFDNSIYLEYVKKELQQIALNYRNCCTLEEYQNTIYELITLIINNQMSLDKSSVREDIQAIDAYIRSNMDKKITLSSLACHVNKSESYLSRIFKASTGMNLIQYTNIVKINHAKELLADPTLSIKEISLSLGFEESSYFNRIFNKICGINPSDYRKEIISKLY